jgi:hypothetical protein
VSGEAIRARNRGERVGGGCIFWQRRLHDITEGADVGCEPSAFGQTTTMEEECGDENSES